MSPELTSLRSGPEGRPRSGLTDEPDLLIVDLAEVSLKDWVGSPSCWPTLTGRTRGVALFRFRVEDRSVTAVSAGPSLLEPLGRGDRKWCNGHSNVLPRDVNAHVVNDSDTWRGGIWRNSLPDLHWSGTCDSDWTRDVHQCTRLQETLDGRSMIDCSRFLWLSGVWL